ncbi:N-acetylmuramoyl-L-alanine amidase [candidate division KSB1 bacterium]|nr:N-acetylmuramoyl-L-alanine amidase [candidate division KSB1 bacterium]
MAIWKGIIGEGFTPVDFDHYVRQLNFGNWRPQFVVLHNTFKPRFSEWHNITGRERMKNFEHYYRDEQRWSAGPHLFVADDLIWVFTPLITSGVHSPSWNRFSWGVEMVGDYDMEPVNVNVFDNTIAALTTLHAAIGLDTQTLHLHKEDPETTHDSCPGRNVNQAEIIARLKERFSQRYAGEHNLNRLATMREN